MSGFDACESNLIALRLRMRRVAPTEAPRPGSVQEIKDEIAALQAFCTSAEAVRDCGRRAARLAALQVLQRSLQSARSSSGSVGGNLTAAHLQARLAAQVERLRAAHGESVRLVQQCLREKTAAPPAELDAAKQALHAARAAQLAATQEQIAATHALEVFNEFARGERSQGGAAAAAAGAAAGLRAPALPQPYKALEEKLRDVVRGHAQAVHGDAEAQPCERRQGSSKRHRHAEAAGEGDAAKRGRRQGGVDRVRVRRRPHCGSSEE